ncbi:hypothetical protein [Pseudomonas sp. HMWF006]|uniref:hypothetical protein n=1 Tax=Pseudomonas sp. HMWF006 TaxID=2056843 RepID=UPI000D4754F2|nr:hypothetical protein [Pseudomonas sp. HMWF006]PTT01737.1 hypothetical protein DBR24_08200 [Pseudomonas sp. HMWF006]PTT73559.1 hypothetical protein DBR26_02695 [Pseudomonas sp. HMWF007]PTT95467.1 hypothetical protein DBR29_00065 [Pseudomonas sp. HMWF005]
MEKRGDVKLSFFTYFTELEAFITLELEYYKKGLHPELYHALEHLSIDEKIRIATKEACMIEIEDLKKISVWGNLMEELKKTKTYATKLPTPALEQK